MAALPAIVLEAGLFGLGLGFLTSSLSAKYRDLNIIVPFLIQLSMFVTPVIYPLSQLGPRPRLVAAANPITMAVEAFRLAFFGRGTVTAQYLALSGTVTLVVLLVGFALFQRASRTFADTV
jgi:lipopolysaccharide transport system permease protein